MDVTVVHLLPTLMERQLDPAAGDLLRRSLEARGLKFKMPAQTKAIVGQERVQAVRFADGTELAADLVVMAVGIRPNAALAKASGLACERGVLVSDTMQTFDPRIYALGECVQHRGSCYGLVAPLFEQAKVLGRSLVVAVNSDASVKRLNGKDRPIQGERARAEVLAGLEAVDMVVVFKEDTPLELIRRIKPTVLVKGGDYRPDQVVGREVVKAHGGEVIVVDLVKGFSTTRIVEKSRRRKKR